MATSPAIKGSKRLSALSAIEAFCCVAHFIKLSGINLLVWHRSVSCHLVECNAGLPVAVVRYVLLSSLLDQSHLLPQLLLGVTHCIGSYLAPSLQRI